MSEGYKYHEISNKVLRADKRLLDRSDKNAATPLQSMSGKISHHEMGSRVVKTKVSEKDAKLVEKVISKPKSHKNAPSAGAVSVLDSLEGLKYNPVTEQALSAFAQILSWCLNILDSDAPQDVIRSLADILLEIVKDENTMEQEKKTLCEDALGSTISNDQFAELLDLCKLIDDYETNEERHSEEGVGVVFDSGEEEEEEDAMNQIDDDDEDEEDGDGGNEVVADSSDRLAESFDENVSVSLSSVSRSWLQDEISSLFRELDSHSHIQLTSNITQLLEAVISGKKDNRSFENELLELFEFKQPQFVRLLVKNSAAIHFGLALDSAKTDEERQEITQQIIERGYSSLLADEDEPARKKQKLGFPSSIAAISRAPKIVNLESLVFDQGSHLMTASRFNLPQGSFKRAKKNYEEIHVPAPQAPPMTDELVPIPSLPEWAQSAFGDTPTLNRIQSKVYPCAFNSDENMLLCAPTGAGKTNVALLTVLRTLSKFRDEKTGQLDLDKFKIVYIAPLKALVQEQVREFSRKLKQYGIQVNELTGDSNLTKQQISTTQILVTTPEKWDVITRKMSDISYVNLVRLVIIDEIHLLHDERGPVLESIVARSLRSEEEGDEPVRLVGLSATLPNYKDVSTFLKVPKEGLFYFDASYRPCPLAQQFIGITEKRALKRYLAQNDVCYEKVLESVSAGHQVIVFVHSRKDTAKTAKWIRDKFLEMEQLSIVMKSDAGSSEILRRESENVKNGDLKDLLPTGFAIHHAGMNRHDRSVAEDLFAEGYAQVLVSTATLAWGVNLPAHTVIIKGTNVYSPEKGAWVELSPQDILQMLGRAGRPRYDVNGEGVIITSQDEVKYYLAILNQQLPIESQLISRLPDCVNAEIALGTIRSREECVDWLKYTYLYVRMLASPDIYRVGPEYDADEALLHRRQDLAHSALTVLAKHHLVKYDPVSGVVMPTDLGLTSSHFYISHESMNRYNMKLQPYFTEIELLQVFAESEEFRLMPVRQEEKQELRKLIERAPLPVNDSVDDPTSKVSVLLQSYISRLQLEGFVLMADMIYITQSAGRLLRAIFEIVSKKGWARLSRIALNFCKMVERRIWMTNSPLRQFPESPREVISASEKSLTPWAHYLQLSSEIEVAQAFKTERYARLAYSLLNQFPKMTVESRVQPITPSLMRVELEVKPDWVWNNDIHGAAESFYLQVEDCDSEKILYQSQFLVRQRYIGQEHIVDFTVPLLDPLQPNYFVSLISEKWLHCEIRVPIVLESIQVPKKFPAPTPILNQTLVPTSELKVAEFVDALQFQTFNKVQSQVWKQLFSEEDSIFIGCAKGSGKTVMAELALFNHWNNSRGRAVYISSTQEQLDVLFKSWSSRFKDLAGGKTITKLTGDLNSDLKSLASSHLIMATPKQFDVVSRRWRQRRNVQSIELVVADDCHTVGNSDIGVAYETILSRMRFMSAQTKNSLRIVALSASLANGRDFGEFVGASKDMIFNFDPNEKVFPANLRQQSFDINHNASLILSMVRPTYSAISTLSEDETCVVFVPERKLCVDISVELIKHATKDSAYWLRTDLDSIQRYLDRIQDSSLARALQEGVGFYYKNMASNDRLIVERLYAAGALTVLLATENTAEWCPSGSLVVVLSTQTFDGGEHRYVDYPVSRLMEMTGLARGDDGPGTALVLTNASKASYYKKFLSEPLPIESFLNFSLHDCFLNEISTGLIKSRQDCIDWITYSYFYRRLHVNPSFYGVSNTSHLGISEYLSDLVELTLNDLVDGKLIELNTDEEDTEESEAEISPLNGCMISAYHNVSFITMQTFMLSLTAKTKLKGLLEILSASFEFESIPIRHHEQAILTRIYNRVPVKATEVNYESPAFKTFLLLQAHFGRLSLPPDLASDQKSVLDRVLPLVYAAIDILSSDGNLNALNAMDLSQMIVQAVWDRDSPLKQIPFFDETLLERCEAAKVETVYDIMALEDDERDAILEGLTKGQLAKVAEWVNSYPNLEINYELDLSTPLVVDDPREIEITLTRDEEPEDLTVIAPHFTYKKQENWWIVIGDSTRKQLYAIKKVIVAAESQTVKLQFAIPDAGHHKLTAWCVCDSYVDADKELNIEVDVVDGDADVNV